MIKINQKMESDIYFKRIEDIIYYIRRLAQTEDIYTKKLNKIYKVSSTQLHCLLVLLENGPLPISMLAKKIMVNSSTATGIIDRLEKKGFVKRVRISSDRRVITIQLTKRGKDFAEKAPPPVQQKIVDGLKDLTQDDFNQIVDSFVKLTNMLDTQGFKTRE
jgi:DNA-binding MarR family transcriptional regulator